ncbi:MAG: hypothetical protein HP497_09825 [Nitrospira sp.]|nr:hypothetical protein [Nitrospira sp.]
MKSCVFWLLGLTLALAISSVHADSISLKDVTLDDLPPSSLLYVSDYFSFVGQDSQGQVAFALDNNRGRDGDTYQAQHFLVLHDEKTGWARLYGNNGYENVGKELKTIPGSPYFQFQGTPRTGMTIVGESNRLMLKIEPIEPRTNRRHDGAVVWMGSAPAVLTWRDRVIPGRVIHEYFMMPDFNRLTHTYWDLLNEYQGFYLKTGTDDVYLHRQHSKRLAPLMGFLDGFSVFNGATDSMKDLTVAVLDHELGRGFYRWPIAWRIAWTGPQGQAVLILKRVTRTGIWNWAIGGFSMVVVDGELEYGGKKRPVYGLVEVIM